MPAGKTFSPGAKLRKIGVGDYTEDNVNPTHEVKSDGTLRLLTAFQSIQESVQANTLAIAAKADDSVVVAALADKVDAATNQAMLDAKASKTELAAAQTALTDADFAGMTFDPVTRIATVSYNGKPDTTHSWGALPNNDAALALKVDIANKATNAEGDAGTADKWVDAALLKRLEDAMKILIAGVGEQKDLVNLPSLQADFNSPGGTVFWVRDARTQTEFDAGDPIYWAWYRRLGDPPTSNDTIVLTQKDLIGAIVALSDTQVLDKTVEIAGLMTPKQLHSVFEENIKFASDAATAMTIEVNAGSFMAIGNGGGLYYNGHATDRQVWSGDPVTGWRRVDAIPVQVAIEWFAVDHENHGKAALISMETIEAWYATKGSSGIPHLDELTGYLPYDADADLTKAQSEVVITTEIGAVKSRELTFTAGNVPMVTC